MARRPEEPAKAPLAIKEGHGTARSKILERIKEGEQLKSRTVESVQDAEAFEGLYHKWNEYNLTLLEVLFTNSDPKRDYDWSAPATGATLGRESPGARHRRRVEGITLKCRNLDSLVARLELIPVAAGVVPNQVVSAYEDVIWSLIHAKVRAVARKRFDDGHYADAVEAALKELSEEVKRITKSLGAPERDGADLMHTAFSPNKPVIALADLSTQTGKDMQQGYMELFAGAISAIRNPKAHANIAISPERAIHLLFLASTLWFTLDDRL